MRNFFAYYFGGFLGLFFLIGMILGLILHIYTQNVVHQLRDGSRTQVQLYAKILSDVAEIEDTESTNLDFVFKEFIQKISFPIIITDRHRYPVGWRNVNVDSLDRSEKAIAKVQKLIERMDRKMDPEEIRYQDMVLNYIYYGDSILIKQLELLPAIEVVIVGIIVLMGFIGYANTKKSEQRSIWVGMAKETAHQLGTPISSLLGWIELMQTAKSAKKEEILPEMQYDVLRLKQVSNRFSQIGSKPMLEPVELKEVIQEAVSYIRRRAPQIGKPVVFHEDYDCKVVRHVNRDIFQWALENILKNALDAMDKPEGIIQVRCKPLNNRLVFIEIQDNGRGISEKHVKRIFKPGYSTKKRGWGLGLSLAKRIIEEYHKGKLFVKESKPGAGTVIRIEM